MARERSPTLRRRELARQLRDLRKQAGPHMTVDKVAESLSVSPATISRIETGARGVTRRNLLALCELYGVDDAVRTRLLNLASEANREGWWSQYEDIAIDPLIGLEIEAAQISSFESCIIPWMFQTDLYARAVIKGILPRIRDNVLQERVNARLKRQELLKTESAPNFWSLVDESALRRRVGGSQTMYDQLTVIVERSTLPNVTFQIVPFKLGAHPGLDNTFTFLEFRFSSQSPIVYVENMSGMLYLERPADVDRYREALQYLRAIALDPENSVSLIEEIRETFNEQ